MQIELDLTGTRSLLRLAPQKPRLDPLLQKRYHSTLTKMGLGPKTHSLMNSYVIYTCINPQVAYSTQQDFLG